MKEPFLPQAVIARKRDGEVLEKADIEQFVTALTQDRLSDAQVGAFAMAVFLKSMTTDECAALTLAMRDSGAVLEVGSRPVIRADNRQALYRGCR